MSEPRIGLALGGGSARGLAHIPLLEVFDELGLKPSVISGCSIGAVMGAAYAGGMTARDMRAECEALLSSRADAARHVFQRRGAKLSDLLSLRGAGSLLLQGERVVDLVLPDHLPKTLEALPIPLKIVTTDFELQEERVITSGSLISAVAASIAIPGIISGPKIDGRTCVDGGVTNPVPFSHVQQDTDITVAIDVTGRPRFSENRHLTNRDLAIGSLLIMFRKISELRRAIDPPDIYIEPPLAGFSAFDFFRPKEMWAQTEPAKDELKRALEYAIGQFEKQIQQQ